MHPVPARTAAVFEQQQRALQRGTGKILVKKFWNQGAGIGQQWLQRRFALQQGLFMAQQRRSGGRPQAQHHRGALGEGDPVNGIELAAGDLPAVADPRRAAECFPADFFDGLRIQWFVKWLILFAKADETHGNVFQRLANTFAASRRNCSSRKRSCGFSDAVLGISSTSCR